MANPQHRPNGRQDRRGGTTQLSPRPGTNGRTDGRDDRRILRYLVAAAVVLLLGALVFNGFWWSDSP
ncbi:MAG: hypothetical protein EOO27_00665 [Comamonadaceae bacterium]|nr:MAG: hypothetical protein EOO27_00665 [Comamonadaceae bacterium]